MIGAIGGAAVASSSSGATSPGCPPGYVARRDATVYSYGPPGYYYAAPDWYVPWVFMDGYWAYRPYPYHDFYWHNYGGYGHGGYGHGGYGHGGYGGGHGGGHRH